MDNNKAIIDIGSNTIRLIIYRIKAENMIKEMENIKVSARLQNYIDHNQILNPEGINVLLKTLMVFKEIISLHKVTSTKAVATAAIRQAKNQDEIKQCINDKIGISVKILSEEEEAFYGFLGVIRATDINDGITIDLGGGSIEITRFSNRKMVNYHSFPMGVLSLNQQFVKNKIPTDLEISELSNYLQLKFQRLKWLGNCQLPIIGIGGSARNLGEIDLCMKDYPLHSLHQYEMKIKDILMVKAKLESLSLQELQNVKGLSKERSDIIFPAIEVFLSIYRTVNAPFFQLSEKGIRDGIMYDEIKDQRLNENDFHPNLDVTLQQIALEFDIDLEKRLQVVNTVKRLCDTFGQAEILEVDEQDLNDLRFAGYLYNLGEFFERDSASAHTFYFITNQSIEGFSHKDRIKLALLASYQSKDAFKNYVKPFKEWFPKKDRRKLRILGSLLKLSFALNRTKRNIILGAKCQEKEGHLHLELYCNKSWQIEQQEAEKQIRHLEKSLGRTIVLEFQLTLKPLVW
ncbi:Ppx/GppA family phosphatase [Neobacillus ginsengisoli]|uniref:Exopolyphosphatase/guanosine-5'-triphosphate, 3'-diphosphate pyrophosphatase n=1 Tax=Neobacillus ginsengisoli TaxID=904295 RepID=A0ABT9XU86_9BACI|nr:Ppx/GppA family phosphatase [Neobacillus ginsengisoli]MDQ0199116.1 exopolyphosphatase/guanosine-5'-triphosphate,3'-diphosphate pyrophosphatase [Neobacillus ginsengisoli]